jgi:hypothetical protein
MEPRLIQERCLLALLPYCLESKLKLPLQLTDLKCYREYESSEVESP